MKTKPLTSTEKSVLFRERNKKLGRNRKEMYLTNAEFDALKLKLKELRVK